MGENGEAASWVMRVRCTLSAVSVITARAGVTPTGDEAVS